MVRLGNGGPATRRRAANSLSALGVRFERSFVGEGLISAVLVLVILIGVVWNLPDSAVKRTMTPTLYPIAASTGLEQKWSMYAPDPVSRLETVDVRVTMADGSVRVWTWRRGDRVIGPFSWYRWQKLKEQLVRRPAGRADVAYWVVREVTAPTERPVQVVMTLRNEVLPPPGEATSPVVTVETLFSEYLIGRP